MKTCIYTKTEFANADGEHILQNFLGARWVSHDISCNEAQSIFGETIDSALEAGLRQFRVLLGTRGGRGGDGPTIKNVEDTKGNKYHILPGGTAVIAEPVVSISELESGTHAVQTKFAGMKQFDWAVAKLRSQFPGASWDIEEIKGKLTSETEYLDDRIHLRAGIGGRDYFRGLLKVAFNLLGVNAADIALQPCFDPLRNYILNGVGAHGSHIRWLATADELAVEKLGYFDHFVAICSNGKSVDGVVQFFGSIGHIVRLTNNYDSQDFCYGYQVNPLRDTDPAENRQPDFDAGQLPRFDDGYDDPGPDLWPIYQALFSRFMKNHYDFATKKEISRIVDGVLAPHEGSLLSEEIIGEFAEQVSKFMVSKLRKK